MEASTVPEMKTSLQQSHKSEKVKRRMVYPMIRLPLEELVLALRSPSSKNLD